jgi:hypothetical protein
MDEAASVAEILVGVLKEAGILLLSVQERCCSVGTISQVFCLLYLTGTFGFMN